MSSASSTEAFTASATSSRLATMPRRMPRTSAFLPTPVTSIWPSSRTFPMTVATLEVPMSIPTMWPVSLAIGVSSLRRHG